MLSLNNLHTTNTSPCLLQIPPPVCYKYLPLFVASTWHRPPSECWVLRRWRGTQECWRWMATPQAPGSCCSGSCAWSSGSSDKSYNGIIKVTTYKFTATTKDSTNQAHDCTISWAHIYFNELSISISLFFIDILIAYTFIYKFQYMYLNTHRCCYMCTVSKHHPQHVYLFKNTFCIKLKYLSYMKTSGG